MKRMILTAAALLLCCGALTSCAAEAKRVADGQVYVDYDVAKELWLDFSDNAIDLTEPNGEKENKPTYPNDSASAEAMYTVRVVDSLVLYASADAAEVQSTLPAGQIIQVSGAGQDGVYAVFTPEGEALGYAKDVFSHTVDAELVMAAQLPIVYGNARTSDTTSVPGYSHLVDIREYFRCFFSLDNEPFNTAEYDIKVCCKLTTAENATGKPFYGTPLCLVQADMIPLLKKVTERLRADGYTLVIYDAYRPTAVHQKWYDKVKNAVYVANPSVGLGAVHDRGTAIDVALLDANGQAVPMPSAVYTFREESARTDADTPEQKNANYLFSVMTSCGFTAASSDWWHFQMENTVNYLPMCYDMDKIPVAPTERN